MLALYDADRPALASTPKAQWLKRFQSDGYYLDDLCKSPVNRLSPLERSQTRQAAVSSLLRRIEALSPKGIIVCHSATFRGIADVLKANRLSASPRDPIPFPLGRIQRRRFAEKVRAAYSLRPLHRGLWETDAIAVVPFLTCLNI